MNAYRELITLSRELARNARERGIHIRSLHLLDAAREADAQLARDENDRENLRADLDDLFANDTQPCGCGGNLALCRDPRHWDRANELVQRGLAARKRLQRRLALMGGPFVAKPLGLLADLRSAVRDATESVDQALDQLLEQVPEVPTNPQKDDEATEKP